MAPTSAWRSSSQRLGSTVNTLTLSNGTNTLALVVTGNGGAADVLEKVVLTNLATVRGGVPLSLVNSPGF